MRSLLLLLFLTTAAAAQVPPRNRITFSGGWSQQLQNSIFRKETATGLGLSYGFRAKRFLELEGGMFTQLQPGPDLCSRNGCVDPNDLYLRIPFGFRLVAPLGRWELSAGGGGLSLDRNRHWWLGFSPHFFLSNPPDVRDRWMF